MIQLQYYFQYPPTLPEHRERGMAKLLMDAVFHENFAVYRKPVQQFFRERVDQVIKELETTKVEKGVRIWKVYNMGFIARTKTVTIAFDLVTGITSSSADFAMSAEQVSRLAKQCDVLLISHRHFDHADKTMAARFLEMGFRLLHLTRHGVRIQFIPGSHTWNELLKKRSSLNSGIGCWI